MRVRKTYEVVLSQEIFRKIAQYNILWLGRTSFFEIVLYFGKNNSTI